MAANSDGPIKVHRFDKEKLRRVVIRPGTPTELVSWNDVAIDQPECFAGFQEVRPGEPMDYWVMWFDEVQYALSGRANVVYRMPPSFDEEFTTALEAGDLYMLPIGCDFKWEVIGDEPFRTVILALPQPQKLKLYEDE